ncbi:E3 ubiquitin-protein ligase RNF4-like [Stegodyphus dumicola]|uniref:E3 ubiquitin-protein ligase RNF4-like n=1 Tax=Stegodyphus dumicola TaxID=202533 RepID=UPI0015ADA808|nr:E3 ubiquitin-protein ligase RNF4-like [Stegodyphus dumicola]
MDYFSDSSLSSLSSSCESSDSSCTMSSESSYMSFEDTSDIFISSNSSVTIFEQEGQNKTRFSIVMQGKNSTSNSPHVSLNITDRRVRKNSRTMKNRKKKSPLTLDIPDEQTEGICENAISHGTGEPINSGLKCPVCLNFVENIVRNGINMVTTPCGHLFCNECMDSILKRTKQCPTCRKSLVKQRIRKIYL